MTTLYPRSHAPRQMWTEAQDQVIRDLYVPKGALAVAALGIAYLVGVFLDKGGLAALDLNTYNLGFLMLALVLHGRPRSFLKAVSGAIPATGGVLVQFPFYGGGDG